METNGVVSEQAVEQKTEEDLLKEKFAMENIVIKSLTKYLWDDREEKDVAMQQIMHFANNGNGYACYQLAKFFLFKQNDLQTATPYIKMGIENGNDSCYAILAKAYEKGIGVERNYKKARQKSAIKLLRRADKKGDRQARSYLENIIGYVEDKNAEQKSIEQFYESQLCA